MNKKKRGWISVTLFLWDMILLFTEFLDILNRYAGE